MPRRVWVVTVGNTAWAVCDNKETAIDRAPVFNDDDWVVESDTYQYAMTNTRVRVSVALIGIDDR